jgi:hypothetical protein
MPRGRAKNPENHTPQEAVAYFLRWAERSGYDGVPAIRALRREPKAEHVHAVIAWAEEQKLINVARRICGNAPYRSTEIQASSSGRAARKRAINSLPGNVSLAAMRSPRSSPMILI